MLRSLPHATVCLCLGVSLPVPNAATFKSNIRKSLVDMETELKQPPPPSVLQGAASYANNGEVP